MTECVHKAVKTYHPLSPKHTVCDVSQVSHDCLRWTQHDQNSWKIYMISKQSRKVRKVIASDLSFEILNYSDFGQVYLLQTETCPHIHFVGTSATRPYTILQRHLETKVEKTICKNFTPFLSRRNSLGATLSFYMSNSKYPVSP